MGSLITNLAKWIGHKLWTLGLILLVLLTGQWFSSTWQQLQAERSEVQEKESILSAMQGELKSFQDEIKLRSADWNRLREQSLLEFDRRIAEMRKQMATAQAKLEAGHKSLLDLQSLARTARKKANDAKAQRDKLQVQANKWFRWYGTFHPKLTAQLTAAKATYSTLDAAAATMEKDVVKLAETIQSLASNKLFGGKKFLVAEREKLKTAIDPEEQKLRAAKERKASEIQSLTNLIESQKERIEKDPKQRIYAAIRAQLPTALLILLGVILVPVAIKSFFYFVLAPLASALPPIRIVPDDHAVPLPEPAASTVSVSLDIPHDEEILVNPSFLQSSSKPSYKQTQWLLNARIPFSSIASRMYALTCIRPESEAGTRVVVASQNDAFGELCSINIPDGAAMVLQPRALVGVVKKQGVPVQITRHWRLNSLHAWLTLQLRFLVFHGPCTLVVKGCRGVRAEAPDPNQPRIINQAATIGFSANLEYKNSRCETFISYLRGKEDLFNDLFGGGPGRFIYEQMPAGGRRTGLTGRGLEGVVDAALKVFGI